MSSSNKLLLYKKADRILTFTFPTGTDLNGDTIFFTAKRRAGGAEDDSDALIVTSTTIATSTNIAQISISSTLSNVAPGDFKWDIKRVTSGGEVTSFSTKDGEIKQTVTQRES